MNSSPTSQAGSPTGAGQSPGQILPDSFGFVLESLPVDAEKRALSLFGWLSNLERDLLSFDGSLKPVQGKLESLLIKCLLNTPSRPIYRLVGRCLNTLFDRGDPRSVFDVIAALQNTLKTKLDITVKLGISHVLGIVTQAHGSRVLSLFPETANCLLKNLKAAKEADLPSRNLCLVALTLSLKGAGKGANETLVKELLRLGKLGLSDKTILIRSSSIELLEALYTKSPIPPPLSLAEFESLLLSIFKSLEGSSLEHRRVSACLTASLLTLSQKPPPISKGSPKRGLLGGEIVPPPVAANGNILSVVECLNLFPTCFLKSPTKEVRVGIMEAFASTLKSLGVSWVESHYSEVSKTLIDLASNPKLTTSNENVIWMRQLTGFILRDVIGKMLSESGQALAVRELIGSWIKPWSGKSELSKYSLMLVLDEISALIQDLGPAATAIQEGLLEALLVLLVHPSSTVKMYLAWTFRSLCLSLPSNISKILNGIVPLLQKEAGNMSTDRPESIEKVLGYSHVISAVIGTMSHRVLYAVYEDAAALFGIATQLIKASSTGKNLRIMGNQALVGWTIVASLMTLGPNFVNVHISQLLLIWKNVLPKPNSKDSNRKSDLEWAYVLYSRDAALTALHAFLVYNASEVVTSDIAKRIAVCLNNSLLFVSSIPPTYNIEFVNNLLPPLVSKLYERECRLKKRLFKCFAALNPTVVYDTSFTMLLKLVVETFAMEVEKGDRFAPPASKELEIETMVKTSLVSGCLVTVASHLTSEDRTINSVMVKDTEVKRIEDLVEVDHLTAIEHDSNCLFFIERGQHALENREVLFPVTSNVGVVDSAIELFGLLFGFQSTLSQESLMEHLLKTASVVGGKVTPLRKSAGMWNCVVAVICVLRHVMARKEMLHGKAFITSPNPILRIAAAEIIGRLMRVANNPTFVNPIIQGFVDQVVNVRDSDTRAGACLALGTIHSFMGGMAGGSHLKTVVQILHSLAADSHPVVHTWALYGLWLTIESAGLMFGPFVNSTLSLIVKLYMSESHESCSPAANYPGGDSNTEVYPAFGRILHALVGVIGPELSMSPKLLDITFSLFDQLKSESDPFVVVEAIRCVQNFILFAPKSVNIKLLIPFLQRKLTSDETVYQIRKASVTCLYQLTQRDPGSVLDAAVGGQLQHQLLALLDVETDWMVRAEIKDIIVSLIKFLAPVAPSPWIELSKEILSRTGTKDGPNPVATTVERNGREDDDDEEGEKEKPVVSGPVNSIVVILLPRWRTRIFALSCIRLVVQTAIESDVKEHGNLALARATRSTSQKPCDFLVFKLVELIRVAFTASTADVTDLRLAGLYLLEDVLQKFAQSPDPDFEGHPLLEQYQAQIISALAPAFSEDSSPETISAACSVAAFFIRSGISLEISSIARPIKLLTNLLESVSNDAIQKFISPTATVMVTVAVLNAWADLFVSRGKIPELEAIMNPNLPKLVKLWISMLRDYARMSLDEEEDASGGSQFHTAANQTRQVYSAATSTVTLPFYRHSWQLIIHALSDLVELQSPVVAPFLVPSGDETHVFFVLFGLCVGSLALTGHSHTMARDPGFRRGSEVIRSHRQPVLKLGTDYSGVLKTVRRLFSSSFLETKFIPLNVFLELLDVYDRLSQAEHLETQLEIALVLHKLVVLHKKSLLQDLQKDKLYEHKILRIIKLVVNILSLHVPGLVSSASVAVSCDAPLTIESASVVGAAMDVLVRLASDSDILKAYGHVLIPQTLIIFAALLESDKFVGEVGQKTLVQLKTLVEVLSQTGGDYQDVLSSFTIEILNAALVIALNSKDLIGNSPELNLLSSLFMASMICISGLVKITHSPGIQTLVLDLINTMFSSSVPGLPALAQQGMRSLILLAGKPDSFERNVGSSYIRVLVPILSSRYLKLSQEIHNGYAKEALNGQAEESIKSLMLLISTIGQDGSKYRMLNVVVYLLLNSLLEGDAKSNGSRGLHHFASQTLFSLASSQPVWFKAIVQTLSPSQKSSLESAFKALMSASASTFTAHQPVAPKIQLKSFV